MNVRKVLAIGNSFSEDASAYVHQMAEAIGCDIQIVNLYIGGCSLERHWQNVENNGLYEYHRNGIKSARRITIAEALEMDDWDIIVTQQASHDSGWICSYEPFLGLFVNYLRSHAPNASLYLQETWAYEITSTHGNFMRYNRDQKLMYEKLHECYMQMAEKYQLSVIPSGTVIQKLRQLPEFHVPTGGLSLCRDGFHMSFDYGRYTLACVWLKTLLGVQLEPINYIPQSVNLDNIPDKALLRTIRCAVDSLLST